MYISDNAFYCNTAEESIQEMEKRSGCRVAQIVYPYVCSSDYYISEFGDMYSLRYERWVNKRWHVDRIVHRIKQTANAGISITFTSNKQHVQVKAEKLVYCTFVLGSWDDDIELDFKDRNPKNVHLDNLAERGECLTEESAAMMAKYADVYAKNFDYVMKYIRFFSDIDTEDAEDLTSKAFIYLCSREKKEIVGDFVALWIYYAKKKAQSFWLWRCKPRVGKLDEMEWLIKKNDTPFGLNILEVLPDERWKIALRQQAEGYSQEETAQELGMSVASVQIFRRKARQYMRKYLITDKEIMKIYK